MKLAVISDVHANLPALESTLADSRARGAEGVVCLGDTVGYNAFPSETIDVLRSERIPTVLGNHDLMALGMLEPDRCGPNAREAIFWTRNVLRPGDRGWLESLPTTIPWGERLLMVHSRLEDTVSYLRHPEDFRLEYQMVRERYPAVSVVFTGHTHVSGGVALHPHGTSVVPTDRSLRLDDGSVYFINPGSVGHPRREDYRASYVLWDHETQEVTFRKVHYDIDRTRTRNSAVGLRTDLGPSLPTFWLRRIRARIRRLLPGLRNQ